MARAPAAAPKPANTQAAEVRALRHALVDATPSKVAAVLDIVDALPERGDADKLIEPLRPLLRSMQPDRPLSMQRLMFLPLDPVIVAPRGWQRGNASLPRSALTPLANSAVRAMGGQAEDIRAAIGPARLSDLPRLAGPATMLWEAVAGHFADPALASALAGDGIARDVSGLSADELAAMGHAIAPMLRLGLRLLDATDARLPAALLSSAAGVGTLSWEMALALLLERLDDRAGVLAAARQVASLPAHHRALDCAQTAVLDRLHTRVAELRTAPSSLAAAELERAVAIIGALGEAGPAGRQATIELSTEFAAIARARLSGALAEEVLKPIHRMNPTDSAGFVALEEVVRDIRRIDFAGRSLASGAAHDAALSAAAGAVAAQEDMPEVARARLIELMLGPDEAARRFPQLN